DQDFRFTKAKIDVARYAYETAVQRQRSSAEAKKRDLEGLEERLRNLRARLEEVDAKKAANQKRLDELEKTRLEAEKQQKESYAEYTRLNDRVQKIQRGFVWYVRNMPVLDLMNPSLKVNQIMPANLSDDVVFTSTPKVDRCTTCHLGIDKKGYEKAPQPFTTHPDMEMFLQGPHLIEKVGCTSCHQGRGRATSFYTAVHTPSSKDQEEAWGKYTGQHEYHRFHFWDYPMMAK